MKKILFASLIGLSFTSFSQKQPEELVVVEKQKELRVKVKPVSIVSVAPASLKQAVLTGFKTGSATTVSAYFAQNVDVSLLNKENLYSKSQAEQVLKTFFADHRPSNFVINHEGQSSNAKYFIGTLTTSNGTFRITINTKGDLISRLTIER